MLAIDQLVKKAITLTSTVQNLIPQVWAAQIEKNLRRRAVLETTLVVNADLTVPNSGDTVYIPILPDLGPAQDLTEGTDMVPIALTSSTVVPLVPAERGVVVEVTRKMLDRIKYNAIEEIMDRLSYAMSLKIEGMIGLLWNATVPGSGNGQAMTVIYPNGKTNLTITSADVLADAVILAGVAQLEVSNNVPWDDGYYRLFISPKQFAQLMADQNIRQDLRYAAPERLLNGEKGAIHGCRIIVTNYVPYTGNSLNVNPNLSVAQEGAAGALTNVAKSLLLAPRWAAIAYKRHPEAYIDPTLYDGGRRRRFGITADFDLQLLHFDRGVVLSTANS